MCGIAGYILNGSGSASSDLARRLITGIRQRGPDDEGVCLISRRERSYTVLATERTVPVASQSMPFFDGQFAVPHDAAILHARYAVIDTSAAGHQPFESPDGSTVVAFNGEIYNYLELKEELSKEGASFWTASDTEVLVEGYRRWKNGVWERLNGFWAAVIYDRKDNVFVFCRDRLGVAPLYYRETSEGLYFSSLIGPLLSVSPKSSGLDRDSLCGFLETGIKDLGGRTMYEGVRSLPSGQAFILKTGETQLSRAEVKR